MGKLGKRFGLGMALVIASLVATSSVVWAETGAEPAILEAFRKGVAHFEAGEYDKAREAFDKVLASQPGFDVALQMRDLAEMGVLIQMKNNKQLAPAAEKLLDLMMRATREQKRAVKDPQTLLKNFQSRDVTTYSLARVELKGHGPYAVPYLISLLRADVGDAQAEAARREAGLVDGTMAVGRTISLLADAQLSYRDVCLPLICALRGTDDPLLQARIAGVLGQLKDRRAVPALLAVQAAPNALESVRRAAADAVRNVAGRSPEDLGPAAGHYVDLAQAYLFEDAARVGYTFGFSADIWRWDAAGADLSSKLTYESVPFFLYYPRMAAGTALEGLSVEPSNPQLQSCLAAALVREFTRCEFFKSPESPLAGEGAAELRKEAERRAAELRTKVPVAIKMLPAPVVAGALQLALKAEDGASSLLLCRLLADKLAAAGPAAPDPATVSALMAALDCGDKDVRYTAAITIVRACPTGETGDPQKVMGVMSAALRAAAMRNALVLINDMQIRNQLVSVLQAEGLGTAETRVDAGLMERTLAMQPSVDIIFLSGNVSERVFARTMELLDSDARTKAAVLYVVVDPSKDSPDLKPYGRIEKVLSPDHLTAATLQPILKEKVLSKSRSAFTEEEEAIVLKATQALATVPPLNTKYDVRALEPHLIKALTGYSAAVSAAAIGALGSFGTEASFMPLSEMVARGASVELKVAACRALSAILKRSQAPPPPEAVKVLKDALSGDVQELREAAADALSAARLSPEDSLGLLRAQGLGLK